jgi:hypothetical protein
LLVPLKSVSQHWIGFISSVHHIANEDPNPDFVIERIFSLQGSDCIEKFAEMQKCMQNYPELFEEKRGKFTDDEDTEDDGDSAEEKNAANSVSEKDAADKDKEGDSKDVVSPAVISESKDEESKASSVELSAVSESLDAVSLADSNSAVGGTTAPS